MDSTQALKAPFVYFGGKRKVAQYVWSRLGDVKTYIEPFCGSAAVLLNRPLPHTGREIINDLDGYVVNFWRALKADPEYLEYLMYYPSTEIDLHSRFDVLKKEQQSLRQKLRDNDDFFDIKLAQYFAQQSNESIQLCGMDLGQNQYNGINELCSKKGVRPQDDYSVVLAGKWVLNRNNGIGCEAPDLKSRQVNSTPNLTPPHSTYTSQLSLLAKRLVHVYITSGDWKRVVKPSVIKTGQMTAIFLDPPYSQEISGWDERCYSHSDGAMHDDILVFCKSHTENENIRVALCGHQGTYDELGWERYDWVRCGGFANMSKKKENVNRKLESIWFSPSCKK